MNRQKVLVSACLLGDKVRYDGTSRPVGHSVLDQWLEDGRVIKECPETLGGLLVPRPAAEIEPGFDGHDIYHEEGKVITRQGHNVSQYFVRGARRVIERIQADNIRIAVMKANSPSCGNEQIYSGEFNRTTRTGQGVTAAALTEAGVRVFNEHQLEEARQYLEQLESEEMTPV